MHNVSKYLLIILTVALIAGCLAPPPKSPGQVVAAENHYENGLKQYNMGHYKQAQHEFEKACAKNPGNFHAYYYLGMCHKWQNEFNAALSNLQKSLELNGNDPDWVKKVNAQMDECHQAKAKGKGKNK